MGHNLGDSGRRRRPLRYLSEPARQRYMRTHDAWDPRRRFTGYLE